MSARRKGKPTQRRNITEVEREQDILTCGDCQQDFLLSDIALFIKHKVNRCNKENVDPFDESDFNNEDGHQAEAGEGLVSSVINSRKPSISAPITQRKGSTPDHTSRSPRPAVVNIPAVDGGIKDEKEAIDATSHNLVLEDAKPVRVNIGSNTINSEPILVTCNSCKKAYNSAWSLLQHAQHIHNLQIYEDRYPESPSPVKTPLGSTSSAGNTPEMRSPNNRERDHSTESHRAPSVSSVTSDSSSQGQRRTPQGHHSIPPILHRSSGSMSHRGMLGTPPTSRNDLLTSPPNPAYMMRMPMMGRPPVSPFSRPPGVDFRFDFMSQDHLHRMHQAMNLPPNFEGLPNPFSDRSVRPPPPPPPPPAAHKAADDMDFYSQRLRQLARSNSPPPQSRSGFGIPKPPTPLSGGAMGQTSPFSASSQGQQSPAISSASSSGITTPAAIKSSSVAPLSEKQKSCEYCGKIFRFQSNLIVHRRSHTGEKPFRCPMCPHACSQASKLKRHMRIHKQKASLSESASQSSSMSTGSAASERSGNSTPESRMSEDEDEEEEDEEDAMEDIRRLGGITEDANEQLKIEKEERELMDEDGELTDEEPTDLTVPEPSSKQKSQTSVLNELMKKSGLQNIEQYEEAYRQALEEGIRKREPTDSSNDGVTENGHSGAESANEGETKPKASSHNYEAERESKRIKLEEPSKNPFLRRNFNLNPHLEAMYPRMWPTFPHGGAPPPPFLPFPGGEFPPMPFPGHQENGMLMPDRNFRLEGSPKASSSSMSTAPVGRSSMSSSPSSPQTPIGMRSRRSDTCEFCGKVFKNCSNLTVHRRSHTGEKPYKCGLCSYACAQSSKLTRHMRTHGRLGKSIYHCKFCAMPFSVPSTLEKHMRKCVEAQTHHHPATLAEVAMATGLTTPPNSSPMMMSRSLPKGAVAEAAMAVGLPSLPNHNPLLPPRPRSQLDGSENLLPQRPSPKTPDASERHPSSDPEDASSKKELLTASQPSSMSSDITKMPNHIGSTEGEALSLKNHKSGLDNMDLSLSKQNPLLAHSSL